MYSQTKSKLLSFPIPDCITNVYLVNHLGRTPAMCFRKTGTIFISPEFLKLPVDYQKYIIGHEAGHIALNTRNEFAADDFAVDWCISQNMSLTNCLFAMTKVLSFPDHRPNQKQEQIMRCERQFNRLMEYDANVNKNPKAMEHVNKTIENEMDSFNGKFKKAISKAKPVKKVLAKPIVKKMAKPFVKPVLKSIPKTLVKPIVKTLPLAKPIVKTFTKPLSKPFVPPTLVKPFLSNPILKPVLSPATKAITAIQSNISLLPEPKAPAMQAIDNYIQDEEIIQSQYEDEMDNTEYEEEMEESGDNSGEYAEEEEYVDETIVDELDSFGGGLKARRQRKKEKTEAKAQKKRDEGEAKKLKAQASLELAKQGIVNKGLAGLGEGLGKLKMGDKYVTETEGTEGKILGMSKPLFFGVVAGVIVLAAVAVWYFKFRKK